MSGAIRVWLLGLLAVLVWGLAAPSVPKPLGVDAPAAQFSAARAKAVMARLLGDQRPHPVGSVAQAALQERVRNELAALGAPSETLSGMSCISQRYIVCATVHDIIAQVRGGRGKAILLMAHMDSVPAGAGAADDISGVATILETVRALKSEPPGHPVIVLFTDGEEAGLLGARLFLAHSPWRDRIGLVINAEARGTSGPSHLFQTSAGDAGLIDLYAAGVTRPDASSLYQEIYKVLPNDTDLTPFLKTHVAAANFAFIGGVSHYHTAQDRLEVLDPGSLQSQGDNILGLTRAALGADLAQLKSRDAIYLDVLGRWLPRLPQAFALPLAVLALLLLALTGWLEDRRKRVWRAFLTPPLVPLGCVASGFILSAVAKVWHPAEMDFARSLPLRIALAAGCWAVALMAARSEAASWLWLAGLGLATALFVPGVSPYFVFPALLAALLFLFTVWGGRGFALLLAALAALVIWLQLAAGLESVMGLGAHYLFTVPVGFALIALLPVLRRQGMSQTAQRVSILVSLLVAFGAALMAGFMPAYSPAQPERLSLRYIEQDGKAWWMADSLGPLPQSLRAAAPFPAKPQLLLGQSGMVAPAGRTEFPAPTAHAARSGNRITLDMKGSPRADGMALLLPQGVAGVRIAGAAMTGLQGPQFLYCATPDCATARIDLDFAKPPPRSLTLIEERFGLPAKAASLLKARPDWTVASQQGDVTVLAARIALPR